MNNDFVDSEVHFLRVEGLASEFDLLGTSILAHLSALPNLFSKRDAARVPPTIQGLALLYGQQKKMAGFSNAWVGKAFEYAVADLFNHQSEPYYSLIRQGIEKALKMRVSPNVEKVGLDLDRLSCIRVARESVDAEDLVSAFGRFRILEKANLSVGYAAKNWRAGLEDKVDVIFCEREVEPVYRFAVLASLKANRTRLLEDKVRRDFLTFPLDLGITIETPKFQGVRDYEKLRVPVVHLPMDIASGIRVWEAATEIVEKALLEGEKNRFLQFFRRFWSTTDKRYSWVEFLAKRLQADIEDVVQEIRQTLHQTPGDRITTVPTFLGAKKDAVLDLVTP